MDGTYKVIIVILVVLVAFIIMYYMNKPKTEPKKKSTKKIIKEKSSKKPSEMHPFVDLIGSIEPSILPGAKDDYNDIILTLFEVLNKQKDVLDSKNMDEISKEISTVMSAKFKKFSKKYTREVANKLIKYFVMSHITALLDNYYTGPPINLMVPPIQFLKMEAFPFKYKSKTKNKVVDASKLVPFKYLAYNIPKGIRKEIATIYDNMVDRYAQAVNESVSKLSEVNMNTIKQVNVGLLMMKYQKMMTSDLDRIKKLYGDNVAKIMKSIFMKNAVPLLDNYYTGPGINWSKVAPGINKDTSTTLYIKYPNTNKKNIVEITETNSKTNTTKSLTSTDDEATPSTASSTASSTESSTASSTASSTESSTASSKS